MLLPSKKKIDLLGHVIYSSSGIQGETIVWRHSNKFIVSEKMFERMGTIKTVDELYSVLEEIIVMPIPERNFNTLRKTGRPY